MTRQTAHFVLVFGTLLLLTSCDRTLPAAAAASPQAAARSPEQPAPASDGFKGDHQARRPRFGAGLGTLHAEEGARRARRTSCSSSTTTPASRPGRRTAGGINMPTLDKLAANGLTYTQWHTTALCSPTRSTLLTGRNHHLNGMAAITEGANGFPGASGRMPDQAATIGQILQDGGWSTFWLGKNHNVAEQDVASGASRKQWPLQKGFDRFYGFLGGETNQWYPDLVEDNRFIEPPYGPEQGYHLSKDLADQAIGMIRDQKASNPSRPWFMWFNPGANHAPHHAPKDYIAKYKGKFDDGYEAYRTWVLRADDREGRPPEGHRS